MILNLEELNHLVGTLNNTVSYYMSVTTKQGREIETLKRRVDELTPPGKFTDFFGPKPKAEIKENEE